jgi:hydroxybutyrate-dimer hydrolase
MNGRGLLRPLVLACAWVCWGLGGRLGRWPPLPPGVRGPVTVRVTDGVSDDLLTAGLGKTG